MLSFLVAPSSEQSANSHLSFRLVEIFLENHRQVKDVRFGCFAVVGAFSDGDRFKGGFSEPGLRTE